MRRPPRLGAGGWRGDPSPAQLIALAESGPSRLDEDADALAGELKSALADWSASLEEPRWEWLQIILDELGQTKHLTKCITAHATGGLLVTGNRRASSQCLERTRFSDEDDVTSSGHFRSLLLEPMEDGKSHLDGVAYYAARHARLSGLPPELVATLEAAGRGHDLGKADPRFQAWLKGGNPRARGPLLAKSAGMRQSQGTCRLSGRRSPRTTLRAAPGIPTRCLAPGNASARPPVASGGKPPWPLPPLRAGGDG